jgi:hypothetical protein
MSYLYGRAGDLSSAKDRSFVAYTIAMEIYITDPTKKPLVLQNARADFLPAIDWMAACPPHWLGEWRRVFGDRAKTILRSKSRLAWLGSLTDAHGGYVVQHESEFIETSKWLLNVRNNVNTLDDSVQAVAFILALCGIKVYLMKKWESFDIKEAAALYLAGVPETRILEFLENGIDAELAATMFASRD